MPENTIWDHAEQELGCAIFPDEFQEALPAAQRKLDAINRHDGGTRGSDYLAILVSEAVKQRRFSNFTMIYTRALNEKRTAPEGAALISHQQYSTPAFQNQQGANRIERAE